MVPDNNNSNSGRSHTLRLGWIPSLRWILIGAFAFLLGHELSSNVQQVKRLDAQGTAPVYDYYDQQEGITNETTTTITTTTPWHNETTTPTTAILKDSIGFSPLVTPLEGDVGAITTTADWNVTTTHHHHHASGFCIAYVIGGCMPENPVYRNYFYDIAISVHLMRIEGSMADIVVFVQMSYKSLHDELPPDDVTLLSSHHIQARIIYIPKAKDESFYRTMLDKFRILSLTEYNRVLFMDGDVMARGSLDYLYHLSMNGTLKENVVMAGKTEPANGGFFMLAPKADSLERILQIIRDKEIRGAALPYPHFDRTIGWGHAFTDHHDYYTFIGAGKRMTEWKFHGDFADQGLLYQWVKYEEKSVSIIFKNTVENWAAANDTLSNEGDVILEGILELVDILDNNPALQILPKRHCWTGTISPRPCRSPHIDYIHFTGVSKPWLKDPPSDFEKTPLASAKHCWFAVLKELNDSMRLGIDFDHWQTEQRPLLGLFPTHSTASRTNFSFEV
jgi:hypothetical protein